MCIRDRSCASCWVRARRGSGETASPSWFCSFISCLHAERIPIGSAEANLDVLREILRKTTKPNTPLAVPKISYLHHGLLGHGCGSFVRVDTFLPLVIDCGSYVVICLSLIYRQVIVVRGGNQAGIDFRVGTA